MKKYILIQLISASLITISTSTVFASSPLTLTVATMSTNLNKLALGYKAELKYAFNKNWYAKGDVRADSHNKIGFGSRVGYQYSLMQFKPYAEIGFDEKPSGNHAKIKFAYAAGLKYQLSTHFAPFVEFDNFTTKHRESAKIGASFPISSRYSLATDYIHSLCKKGDGVELKFSIAL